MRSMLGSNPSEAKLGMAQCRMLSICAAWHISCRQEHASPSCTEAAAMPDMSSSEANTSGVAAFSSGIPSQERVLCSLGDSSCMSDLVVAAAKHLLGTFTML